VLIAALCAFGYVGLAEAQGSQSKIAVDLQAGIAAKKPNTKWVREIKGERHVQAVVVTNGVDPEMTDLRDFVLRTGGSVHAEFPAFNALTVQIKANQVFTLAQRKDVVSGSPNREIRRTASTLEAITGALTSNVRSGSTKTSYSGLDGSGIAVLDSGVMRAHDAFLNGSGATRVKRNVSMLNADLANWTVATSSTRSLKPGSVALSSYEKAIADDSNALADVFGHGTHVASVAAGRSKYYASGTPDTTGIAPNADRYDVKVLNKQGYGTISDAIEGI